MNKCETCKFWGVASWQDKGWGICAQTISEDGNPSAPKTLAVAYDYESYCAATHTFKEFGCVMHKIRE